MEPGGSPIERRADRLAALALLVVALALHARFLGGEALVSWDRSAAVAPWQRPAAVWNTVSDVVFSEFAYASHHAARGAAWNPYTALGQAEGLFDPPYHHDPLALLLHALFAPWRARGLYTLLCFAAGGVFMHRCLRAWGFGPRAALLGALAWQLAPMNTRWLEYGYRAALVAWAPLALWAAERAARSLAVRPALLTAGALAGATLCGFYDQAGVLLYLAVGLLILLRGPLRERPSRVVGLAALAGATGAALAAVRLVPMMAQLRQSGRGPLPWEEYFDLTVRLSPRHFVTALLPDALGSPLREFGLMARASEQYGSTREVVLYVGLPALVLALAGARRRSGTLPVAAVCLGALALALPTPLARLPHALLPGFGGSSPGRWLWLAALLVPILVASGAREALRGDRRPLRLGLPVLALTIGLAVALPSMARHLVPPDRSPALGEALARGVLDLAAPGLERGDLPRGVPVQPVRGEGRVGLLLSPTLGPLLLALGTAAALLGLASADASRRRLGGAALVGLLTLDLLHDGALYTATAAPERVYAETPGVARAREAAGAERVLLDRGTQPNSLLPFGIREAGGYSSMLPRRVPDLVAAVAGRQPYVQLVLPNAMSPAWRDALSVRAVLTAPGLEPVRGDGLALAYDGPDLRVWANPTALPRARLHPPGAVTSCRDRAAALALVRRPDFDPTRHVALEAAGPPAAAGPTPPPAPVALEVDEAERVVLHVDAPQGGVLVLADAWADGWSATTEDGRALAAAPAQVALRGVTLPAGFSGRVVWAYRTPGQQVGAALSALAAALALAGYLRARAA